MFGGIALIPEKEIMKKFVTLRRKYDEYFISPPLGIESNLPHMTIFQSYFDDDIDYHYVLSSLSQRSEYVKNLKIQHVGHVPQGWIFSYINNNESLQRLHNDSFMSLCDHIVHGEIPGEIDFTHFNEREKQYHLTYGYKYLFEQYRPHITLGVSCDDYMNTLSSIRDEYNDIFLGEDIVFDRIAFYQAGVFGTCKTVIDELAI